MARKWFVFLCYLQTFLRLQHRYPHSIADQEVMEFLGKGKRQQEEKGQGAGSRGEDYLSWVKTGFGITTQLLGVLIITNTTCAGQITPDTTLGTESSQVNSHVMIRGLEGDRIDGGAVRGSALFHSFSEFNVNDGQRVYFSNPAGITNIFTRVTGANLSHILGTLGVDGGANLFLLNPQGIKFGSNAQLDIQGSFVASTANSFLFPDGSEFSAKNPTAPLLTMSVTPGVQWGASASSGTITNEGNLTVGQDLTLSAGNLDLQGQLHALKDLTLFAQDTVKVRDSVTNPFIASAGGNLTVQGNGGIDILALNHPTQTPFVSGSNLSFISDGKISLDAHFSSGGNFAISPVSGELANWVSLYDPIISANGDVDVAASYTGTSLLVEATGNIRFLGNIEITGPDSNILPTGPDTETLTKNSALILRSGQSTLAYGGVNSGNVLSYSNGSVPEGITLAGDVVLQPFNGIGGIVGLKAASGDVKTQLISTNGQKVDSHSLSYGAIAIGGAISIEASKGSVNTGNLLSYSYSFGSGNGGAIALTAGGNIETSGIVRSSSDFGNGGAIALTAGGNIKSSDINSFGSGNGGAIALTAGGNIETSGSIFSSSYDFGSGGAISLTAGGNIKTSDISSFGSGNGGAIALTAGGNIETSGIYSFSDFGNGGAISLTAGGNIETSGSIYSYGSGNGGAIALTAGGNIETSDIYSYGDNGGAISLTAGGNIKTSGSIYSSYGDNGGAISLTAGGNIKTSDIYSFSSGNGGAIALTAGGNIETSGINSFSDFGNGGAIALAAGGNIETSGIYSSSDFGNGGAIALTAGGNIETSDIDSYGGNGGAISLTAGGNIETSGSLRSASLGSGNGGAISLTAGGNIETSTIYSSSFGSGNGGAISLTAGGNITSQGDFNSFSYFEFGNSGTGGTIFLSAKNGDIVGTLFKAYSYDSSQDLFVEKLRYPFLNSFSVTEQGTAGKGGNVTIEAKNSVSNLDILTLSSSAEAGKVKVESFGDLSLTNTKIVTSGQLKLKIGDGNEIELDVGKAGRSGDVTIQSSGNLTFNNSRIESDTKSSASAGNVTIYSPGLVTFNNSQIIANTSAQGDGGNINITARDSITLSGRGRLSAETTSSGKAGSVSIITPTFNINGGTQVSTNTTSHEQNAGTGGNLTLSANTITLAGMENLTTGLFAQTAGAGIAGKLTLNPYSGHDLQVQFQQPGAEISASTTSSGIGGNLELNAPNSITLSGRGRLSAETTSTGKAGSVSIITPTFNINGGTQVSTNTTSHEQNAGTGGNLTLSANTITLAGMENFTTGLFAQTAGAGIAGKLTLNPYSGQDLQVQFQQPGAEISASTTSSGIGGNLELNAPNSITLSGDGQLAVGSKGTGNGGSISIHTHQLTIEDNAKIFASAENTGKGGSINIQAATLKLDRGEIISESKQSEAGSIKLNLNNLLLLRHNSAISTSAGTQNSGGNGGNIEINLKDGFVIAVPSENSDIIANAFGGNGGNITIRANRILGFKLQEQEALDNIRNNGSSDISASSDVGTQGQVTIQNLNVDPSQGLVQLSTQLIDPTKLIASGCGNNSHVAKGQSEFVITGRGGVPPSPDDTLTAGTAPTTWVTSKTQALSNSSNKRPVVNSNTVSSSETSAPLVEAQGMIRNANGEIILTAQPPVNTLHQSALPAQFCHLTQK